MAEKDLPSMIDYVLKQTGQKDLIYIGHSQGTLIAFSQLGINPRLASQIKLFIAMGPVATVAHIKSPIKLLANYGKNSTQFIWYDIVGKKAFLPSSEIIKWMADTFCNIEVNNFLPKSLKL
jgi:pimeloyl-ACP methyl ester carboxylesterase